MIRIFGIPWHIGHQHEMLKVTQKYDVKFSYLRNNVRRWGRFSHRPDPASYLSKDQFEWVDYYEPGKYDLAVLHLDQQCVNPDIGKGQLYRQLNEVIQDIPKIVINHGTPMYEEYTTEDMVINGGDVQTRRGLRRLEGMKQMIGDNVMVVNSYKAVERWGWGYPIIHGMDKDDWLDLPKEPRVVCSLSPGGLDKYYNRQLLTSIKAAVYEKTGLDVLHTNVNYKVEDWQDYKELIGSALITIYPFLDSPMPRSRTESMLSGACVLTSKYHNADEFIENGVNGFIVPDNPMSYAETIHNLVNYCYKDTIKIGQEGKKTAQKLFKSEQYIDDLYTLFMQVKDGEKPVWNGEKRW